MSEPQHVQDDLLSVHPISSAGWLALYTAGFCAPYIYRYESGHWCLHETMHDAEYWLFDDDQGVRVVKKDVV